MLVNPSSIRQGWSDGIEHSHHEKSTCLTLAGDESLGRENAQALVTFLQNSPQISRLDLFCSLENEDVAKVLRNFLQFSSHLKTVYCRGFDHHPSHITSQGSDRSWDYRLKMKCLEGLCENKFVTELGWWTFDFENIECQEYFLRLMLSNTSFRKLSFTACRFGPSGLGFLETSIAAQTSLEEFALSTNLKDSQCASLIQKLMENNGIQHLTHLALLVHGMEEDSLESLNNLLSDKQTKLQEVRFVSSFLSCQQRTKRFLETARCSNTTLQHILSNSNPQAKLELQQICLRNQAITRTKCLLNFEKGRCLGFGAQVLSKLSSLDPFIGSSAVFLALDALSGSILSCQRQGYSKKRCRTD